LRISPLQRAIELNEDIMRILTCCRTLLFTFWFFLSFIATLSAQDHSMWSNLGIYGGHVQDIAIDPATPSRIFAATYMGRGLYLSSDSGQTWQPVEIDSHFDAEFTFNEQSVYAVAIAPSDPNIVWAAHNYWVDRSADGGATWTPILNRGMQRDCATCGGAGDDFRLCLTIAIHPTNPDIVYVGTAGAQATDDGGAVYQTTDGGGSWNKLNQGVNLDFRVEDIAIMPNNPDIVWAVTNSNGYGGSYDGTVYRSDDGGQHFTSIDPKPATGGILAVAPKPDNPDVVFVGGGYGVVQLTYEDGLWNASYPLTGCAMAQEVVFAPSDADTMYGCWMTPITWGGDGLPKLSRGVFDGSDWNWETVIADPQIVSTLSSLAVHPTDADIVFGGDYSLGMLVTRDHGLSWTPINEGLDAVRVYDVDVDPDQTAHMLAASGSGLYERMDAASAWIRRHNGIFKAVGFHPSDVNAYFGGGNGYVARTIDSGATWDYSNSLGGVFVLDIAVDPVDTARIYITTGQYGRQVMRSLDGGDLFEAVLDGVNRDGQDYSMNKVVIDPHDRMHLLAAGGNFYIPKVNGDLWESPDGGDTWRRTGLTDTIVNAVLVDPRDPNLIYAGCGHSYNYEDEPLFKSTDGGTTWVPATSGMPSGRRELISMWGSSDPNILYAVGNHGFILRYNGASWELQPGNTGEEFYGVFGLLPNDVYAVGDLGMILHFNGQSWQPMVSNTTRTLKSIWAADGNHVFAAGEAGILLFYDGAQWSPMTSPTSENIQQVRGLAADNVFAAGAGGTLLHFDGSQWQSMASGTGADLAALWPVSALDVYCAGDDGVILHYGGSAWSPMQSNSSSDIKGLWGGGADDIFAAGRDGSLLHYDGRQWEPVDLDPLRPYNAIWGLAADRVYLADDLGGVWLYDGREITAIREQGSYDRSVTSLALHRDHPDILYAASMRAGVYISPNQGGNWLNLGAPSHSVYALASGSLYAATGAGMYQLTGTGVLTGQVSDADTLLGIDDASVVTDLGHQCRSIDGGTYMMVVPSGIFDLFALADNYGMVTTENVTVAASDVTRQDFALEPGTNHDPEHDPDDDASADGGGYCFIDTVMQ
jgi:photosystem II stability/assembly factor-like uncharacterized protein